MRRKRNIRVSRRGDLYFAEGSRAQIGCLMALEFRGLIAQNKADGFQYSGPLLKK